MFPREELLAALGSPVTNEVVARLRGFAHVPYSLLERLRDDALAEVWGQNFFVLEKYLAVNLAWSIEQEKYTQSENQFYLTAGNLQTRYGTPLYLVFERNNVPGRQPFVLRSCWGRYRGASASGSSRSPEPARFTPRC